VSSFPCFILAPTLVMYGQVYVLLPTDTVKCVQHTMRYQHHTPCVAVLLLAWCALGCLASATHEHVLTCIVCCGIVWELLAVRDASTTYVSPVCSPTRSIVGMRLLAVVREMRGVSHTAHTVALHPYGKGAYISIFVLRPPPAGVPTQPWLEVVAPQYECH
jgi:hypothetical protein